MAEPGSLRLTNNELLVLWHLRKEGLRQDTQASMTILEVSRRLHVAPGTARSVLMKMERRDSWVYWSGYVKKQVAGTPPMLFSLNQSKLELIDELLRDHQEVIKAISRGRELDRNSPLAAIDADCS